MHEITAQIVLAYMKGYIDQAVRIHENILYAIPTAEDICKERERAIIKELKNIQEKFNAVAKNWIDDERRKHD